MPRAYKTKSYSLDPLHSHKSIRSCDVCRPIAAALASKRWYNGRSDDEFDRHNIRRRVKDAIKRKSRVLTCTVDGCTGEREPYHKFCPPCTSAFSAYDKMVYYKKRVKAGFKRDSKKMYQQRLARIGHEGHALKARIAYYMRKLRDQGVPNIELRHRAEEIVNARRAKQGSGTDVGQGQVVPVAA